MFRRDRPEPPDPATLSIRHLLLASYGREIADGAVSLAREIGRQTGCHVHVLSIARIWGTSFGLPAPGLLPTRREWNDQHDLVAKAVRALNRAKVEADGHVVGTRNPAKRIIAEAKQLGCEAIVMSAEPERHWLIGNLLWSQEPYRVRRRAPLPVYLVTPPAAA